MLQYRKVADAVTDKVADAPKVADKVANTKPKVADTSGLSKWQRYRARDAETKRERDRLRKAASRAKQASQSA